MNSIKDILKGIEELNTSEAKDIKHQEEKLSEDDCVNCSNFGSIGIWQYTPNPRDVGMPDGYIPTTTTVFCEKRFDCTKLSHMREQSINKKKKNSRLGNLLDLKLSDFVTETQIQKQMKTKASAYIQKIDTDWFVMLGQSGSGKTHLCAAICNYLLHKNISVKYVTYTDLMNSTSNYDFNILDEYKKVTTLFIDDLFKTRPNEYEKKVVFELIDYRYANGLRTLISSERTIRELIAIDEAIASRIFERSRKYCLEIPKDHSNNYRFKNN